MLLKTKERQEAPFMKFTNPFKKSKDVRDLAGRPEDAGSPEERDFFMPLMGMRQRRAAVTALVKRFDAIEHVSDPADRLVQYGELKGACDRMAVTMMGVPGVGVQASGMFMIGAAVALMNPALFIGGVITARRGSKLISTNDKPKKWTISPALSRDCKTLAGLAAKVDDAIKTIITREPLLNIAQSPRFEEATAAFPALKDRFLAAAARDRLMQDDSRERIKRHKPDGDGKPPTP